MDIPCSIWAGYIMFQSSYDRDLSQEINGKDSSRDLKSIMTCVEEDDRKRRRDEQVVG